MASVMIAHIFFAVKMRPIDVARFHIISMSAATTSTLPANIMSSRKPSFNDDDSFLSSGCIVMQNNKELNGSPWIRKNCRLTEAWSIQCKRNTQICKFRE